MEKAGVRPREERELRLGRAGRNAAAEKASWQGAILSATIRNRLIEWWWLLAFEVSQSQIDRIDMKGGAGMVLRRASISCCTRNPGQQSKHVVRSPLT